MSSVDDLAYSNNLCCAFLAEIVRAYEANIGGQHYLGRTAVQKLTYFAKVLDVPIPCSFELYTYGPYSEKVTASVDSLLADDVLKDISKTGKYSDYRLGDNASEILDGFQEDIAPFQERIETLVSVLGKFTPDQLELVATVHYVHQRLKRIGGSEPPEGEVIQEFKRFKRDKFANDEIKGWYNALKDAKLI
jgi:uncharacterized protein YwgA